MPRFKVGKPLASPTPIIEPTRVCVVDIGKPIFEHTRTTEAASRQDHPRARARMPNPAHSSAAPPSARTSGHGIKGEKMMPVQFIAYCPNRSRMAGTWT